MTLAEDLVTITVAYQTVFYVQSEDKTQVDRMKIKIILATEIFCLRFALQRKWNYTNKIAVGCFSELDSQRNVSKNYISVGRSM